MSDQDKAPAAEKPAKAPKADKAPAAEKIDDGLIPIKKHGEPDLRIHPDALEQHKKLGWEIIN